MSITWKSVVLLFPKPSSDHYRGVVLLLAGRAWSTQFLAKTIVKVGLGASTFSDKKWPKIIFVALSPPLLKAWLRSCTTKGHKQGQMGKQDKVLDTVRRILAYFCMKLNTIFFSLVIYQCEPELTHWTKLCIRHADVIFILTDPKVD